MADNLYPYFATAGQAAVGGQPVLATKEVSAGVHILKVTSVDQAGLAGSAVQGNSASGATDVGNPVKVGAVFNTTPPTVTNGQRVDAQATNRGFLLTASSLYGGGLSSGADGITNTSRMTFLDQTGGNSNGYLPTFSWIFNGTTWDRVKKPNTVNRLVSSAATNNATNIKGSAGDVFLIQGFNATAGVKYLKLYNKATAPTVGTDTPFVTFALPASAPFTFDFGPPRSTSAPASASA
jgi:hypothetical protein